MDRIRQAHNKSCPDPQRETSGFLSSKVPSSKSSDISTCPGVPAETSKVKRDNFWGRSLGKGTIQRDYQGTGGSNGKGG